MPCPFFQPQSPFDSSAWNPPPRLPLGDAWRGICCAPPAGPFEPREDIQRELCNMGYARGRCQYFPDQSVPDAVRFSVTGEIEGNLQVLYVLEKDHAPLEHGEFRADQCSSVLATQGQAFITSQTRLRAAKNTPVPRHADS